MEFTFARGRAIFPWAVLRNVVPWRAGGMWCSPVGVADSFQWSWVQISRVYIVCVHVIQVQYIAEYSSVWLTVFCFFQDKRKKREKQQAAFPEADRWLCQS
jgi:hypothetical protein